MHAARRLDFTLLEGEVLYIPHNTPHEVTNLSDTCSVSANFIDQTNLADCLRQSWAKLVRRDPSSARHANLQHIARALEEIDFPPLEEDLESRDHEACVVGEQMVGHFPCHERLKDSKRVAFRK